MIHDKFFPCSIRRIVEVIEDMKKREAELMQALIGLRDRDFEDGIEKDLRYSVKVLWEELKSVRESLDEAMNTKVTVFQQSYRKAPREGSDG